MFIRVQKYIVHVYIERDTDMIHADIYPQNITKYKYIYIYIGVVEISESDSFHHVDK